MKVINTTLNEKELTQLALAATDVVHAMDLELPDFTETKALFIALLDTLEERYKDNELLFDARAAILSQPTRKMDIYMITQKLVKLARAGRPSATERFASRQVRQFSGVVRHAAFDTLTVAANQH